MSAPRRPRPQLPLDDALASWLRSLRAARVSPHTLKSYEVSVEQLLEYCRSHRLPAVADVAIRGAVEDFLADLHTRREPSTVQTRYNGLKAFFAWLVREGELETSPMAHIPRPRAPIGEPELLTEAEARRLLAGCDRRTFAGRRDAAILRFLWDTGVRVGGLVSMTVAGTNLEDRIADVVLKGGRVHPIPFGVKAAHDIDSYLRKRATHAEAARPELWLGLHGPLTPSGVGQMVADRAARAGLRRHVYPHLFRHTMVDTWLSRPEGKESDLITILGWTSGKQLERYGRYRRIARAREAHRELSPGDRL